MLLMTGCGNSVRNPEGLKVEDLTLDFDSGKSIHLGMTRTEIEKVLGKGKDQLGYITYGQTGVKYLNEKAIFISIQELDKNIRFLGRKILGVKKSEIDGILGPPSTDSVNPQDYMYKIDGNTLKRQYNNVLPLDYSNKYIDIELMFDETNKIDEDRQVEGIVLINLNEYLYK